MNKSWRRQFPRSFVARDFRAGPEILTIKSWESRKYGPPLKEGEEEDEEVPKKSKIYIDFEETDFGWICGRQACESIQAATGTEDPDQWVGQRIELFEGETTFGDKQVDCIRARTVTPNSKRKRAPKKKA